LLGVKSGTTRGQKRRRGEEEIDCGNELASGEPLWKRGKIPEGTSQEERHIRSKKRAVSSGLSGIGKKKGLGNTERGGMGKGFLSGGEKK